MNWVVGIDFDSHALYVCALHGDDDPKIAAVQLRRSGDLSEAILAVPTALAFAIDQLAITRADAWIERGTGFSRKGDWPLGAIAGATMATWPRLTNGSACRIITTAEWKKTIGAPGNAPKAVANHYATLQWCSRHPGYPPPTNHNHLDAYAIALTGSLR